MKQTALFNLAIFFSILIGILAGFFPHPLVQTLSLTLSNLFIKTLKLISLPMIFLAIVSTITQMSNLSEVKMLLKKILKYTILTTLIAATVGLLLFLAIEPSSISSIEASKTIKTEGSYLSFLTKLIPSNLIEPFTDNNVLGMAFIALALSLTILKLPHETTRPLKSFFQSLFQVLLKFTSGLILLMPVAVFAFTVQFMENIQANREDLKKLFLYAICVIGANLIQGLIILPLFLKRKNISPLKAAKAMMPALTMAFFTKSSNATLSLTLESAKNRLHISDKTAQFSFPLCSIINMNGCAAFILITLFFVCSSEGILFTPFEMIGWIFLASLAAIGNAGVPMGCFFLTTAFLVGMGVPVALMGMILPLYSLFDMLETALNVWSDSCITALVDQEIKEKDSLELPDSSILKA